MTRPTGRRLVVLAIAVCTVGFVATAIHGGGDAPAARPTPAVTATATVTATGTPTPTASPSSTLATPDEPAPDETTTPATQQTEAAASTHAVALDAVRAWQTPDVATRHAALAPLATGYFLDLIDLADPANIPTAAPTGAEVLSEADTAAVVDVTLADGTVQTVALVLDVDGAWKVTDIAPAGAA